MLAPARDGRSSHGDDALAVPRKREAARLDCAAELDRQRIRGPAFPPESESSRSGGRGDSVAVLIERESDRLQRMVRQMLDLAKLESRELQRSPEPVSINSI